MTRRLMLFATVSLVSCSGPSRSLEDTLPSQVDGWTRTQVAVLPSAEAPEIVRQLGLKRAVSATYSGPGVVRVRIFEMNVATSAFELIQRWRQQDGLAVYKGPLFIVADPSSGPAAPDLLAELPKQLK